MHDQMLQWRPSLSPVCSMSFEPDPKCSQPSNPIPHSVNYRNACDASKCDIYVCPSPLHVAYVCSKVKAGRFFECRVRLKGVLYGVTNKVRDKGRRVTIRFSMRAILSYCIGCCKGCHKDYYHYDG